MKQRFLIQIQKKKHFLQNEVLKHRTSNVRTPALLPRLLQSITYCWTNKKPKTLTQPAKALGAMELTAGGMQWDRGRGTKLSLAATEAKGGATLCPPGEEQSSSAAS